MLLFQHFSKRKTATISNISSYSSSRAIVASATAKNSRIREENLKIEVVFWPQIMSK